MLRVNNLTGFGGAVEDGGNDAFTVGLYHFEGGNAVTSYPNEGKGSTGSTLGNYGVASLTDARAKFGTCSFYSGYGGGAGCAIGNTPNTDCVFGSGDFCIDFWGLLFGGGLNQFFWDDRDPATVTGVGKMITLYANTTQNVLFFDNNATRITSTAIISINTMTHIAVGRTAGTTGIWINGIYQGGFADSNVYAPANGRPLIGISGVDGASNQLNGCVDELRISKGRGRYPIGGDFTPKSVPYF